jgi:hypothetical protein
LAAAGVQDGAIIGPLAFVLVLVTVVLHGFTLAPFARLLGLAATGTPGVMLVGGSRFTTSLGAALQKADIPVLISDTNHARLVRPRAHKVPVFYGDILSEAAEHSLEVLAYQTVISASENDAYNTLVSTDLGAEFGREHTWQIGRAKAEKSRHALPNQLGGRSFGSGHTFREFEDKLTQDWSVRITKLSDSFGFSEWKAVNPQAILLARLKENGDLVRVVPSDAELLFQGRAESKIDAMPEDRREAARAELKRRFSEAKLSAALAQFKSGTRLVSLAPSDAQTKP